MNLDQLKQQHLGWLHNPNTSNGQLADSKTILNLIEELERSAERVSLLEEQKALLFGENGRLLAEKESGQWDRNQKLEARVKSLGDDIQELCRALETIE